MRRLETLIVPVLVAASPVQASDRDLDLRIAEMRIDRGVGVLARKARISIGIADPALGARTGKRVAGRMTPAQALDRMLAGTGARARQLAPGVFVIERSSASTAGPSGDRPAPRPGTVAPPPPPDPVEIVVTASKRDLSLADYPGAATIVRGIDLTASEAARGTDALAERVATLTSTHLGPGRNKLFIRGIADSSFTGPTQATVGQYWGHTRVTYSAPDPGLKLHDVESVELLEGPQGTLYGAGSLGGIIRVAPQPPELAHRGAAAWGGVQATRHGDPGGDAGMLVNLPLKDDRLAFRAIGYGGIDGGYIDDRRRGIDDVNRVETTGARAALRLAPDAMWTIDLSGTYQSIAGRDAQYATRDPSGPSRESAIAQPYRNRIAIGELTVTGDLGPARLVSTLGIVDQHVRERFDASTPSVVRAFDQSAAVRLVTSETRIGHESARGGWLFGVNLLRNRTRLDRAMEVRALSAPAAGVSNIVEEATLYGEASWSPLPALAITGGARLTHSRLSGASQGVAAIVAFRNDPGARASRNETRLLPSVALRLRATDRISLFARYQQGYRPGGLAVRSDFIQRFESDRMATAEAGVRYRDPANILALQATVATTRWRDIQADIIDGIGFPTTANIGDGRVHSLGASARWSPVADLSFDASVHLNDSRVTAPGPAFAAAFAGRAQPADAALPNVADVIARAGIDYRRTTRGGLRLDLRAHARYLGQSTLGIGPDLSKPQGDYVDTGADIRLGDMRRGISVSLTNLLDVRGNRFALGSPFQLRTDDPVTPLRPRTIRIGFDHRF